MAARDRSGGAKRTCWSIYNARKGVNRAACFSQGAAVARITDVMQATAGDAPMVLSEWKRARDVFGSRPVATGMRMRLGGTSADRLESPVSGRNNSRWDSCGRAAIGLAWEPSKRSLLGVLAQCETDRMQAKRRWRAKRRRDRSAQGGEQRTKGGGGGGGCDNDDEGQDDPDDLDSGGSSEARHEQPTAAQLAKSTLGQLPLPLPEAQSQRATHRLDNFAAQDLKPKLAQTHTLETLTQTRTPANTTSKQYAVTAPVDASFVFWISEHDAADRHLVGHSLTHSLTHPLARKPDRRHFSSRSTPAERGTRSEKVT